jgi:hypothetical protein
MKTYIVKYWFENRDCADFTEVEVEAFDIEQAIEVFKSKIILYKHIESIIEKI